MHKVGTFAFSYIHDRKGPSRSPGERDVIGSKAAYVQADY